MSLHAGENFDKSEYGLHTSYGDYEYFYDYLGDGDFGVKGKIPLNSIEKDFENETNTDEGSKDADRYDADWESIRRRIESSKGTGLLGRGSVSTDGLGDETVERNPNSESKINNQEGDITPWGDTYYKTGADGTNRPRYEKRYSLKKAPIFFSNTLDAISTPKKLPAKQKVRSWLKTLPPFVEKDEDKWMGLTEWLKGKDPEESLTKEDILDYVRTHDVEMVEVNYSKDGHRNIGENPDYFDVEYRKIVDFATSSTTDFIRSEVGVSLDLTAVGFTMV